ncbi:MAG: cytochrome c biogenesis protein CcdA [Rhodospirillales bacterium]|nr:MAG: cytochrome c biogenesis protein CcdA [Rhodospirillales bacterium]
MGSIALAYVAGLVTLLNPCVLPILPILIAAALGEARLGPAALAAGLVLSFTIFGFLILVFGFSIGLDQETVRTIAAVVLIGAGVLLTVPRAQTAFAMATAPIASGGNQLLSRVSGRGVGGQFAIGAVLGLVWTPCVGPTLGVAIAAASQGQDLLQAFITFLVFAIGVATSLLAFAYGSRQALAARKATFQTFGRWSKPLLGGLLMVVGLMILSGLDRVAEAALVQAMPSWLVDLTVRF